MHLTQAQHLFDQEQYAECIKLLKGTQEPQEVILMAYALQKLQRFEEAMECWNILIQQQAETAQFYCERGVCKFNLRFKHAMFDFDKAIELEPENPYFHACRAYVKDKIGDSEGAVEDYRKAHELDPDDAITLNNLGLAEQKLGHTAKAREFFKKSNDLLGININEEAPVKQDGAPKKPGWSDLFKEVRSMLSSRKEFGKFLKDVFKKS